MTPGAPLTIGIVAGEESGDLLAADLVRSLQAQTGRDVRLVGVGGSHLQALGLSSLFDTHEIGIVGIGAALRQLPNLARRISQTVGALAGARLDCLVTVDVPDFSLRVASRVKRLAPKLPVVHYVSPSVWAWRSGRARAMRAFVNHVLCILPFEPTELERLGGPPGTFVGHRLSHDAGVLAAAEAQEGGTVGLGGEKTLLLLPGSRRGEVSRLIGDFRQAVETLHRRGHSFRLLLPTVGRVEPLLLREIEGWSVKPVVTTAPQAKWQAFASADAALAASGTVLLELALSRVPHVSTYRLDAVGRAMKRFIRSWSGALPNLIADQPVIPEFFDGDIRPPELARYVEALWEDTPLRGWQREGFRRVAEAMRTERPAGELAASVVLEEIAGRTLENQRLAIAT